MAPVVELQSSYKSPQNNAIVLACSSNLTMERADKPIPQGLLGKSVSLEIEKPVGCSES